MYSYLNDVQYYVYDIGFLGTLTHSNPFKQLNHCTLLCINIFSKIGFIFSLNIKSKSVNVLNVYILLCILYKCTTCHKRIEYDNRFLLLLGMAKSFLTIKYTYMVWCFSHSISCWHNKIFCVYAWSWNECFLYIYVWKINKHRVNILVNIQRCLLCIICGTIIFMVFILVVLKYKFMKLHKYLFSTTTKKVYVPIYWKSFWQNIH